MLHHCRSIFQAIDSPISGRRLYKVFFIHAGGIENPLPSVNRNFKRSQIMPLLEPLTTWRMAHSH
jgi:hypothetical protein